MAQTTEQLIQAAYREGNLIPIGKQPTATEVAETLEVYRRWITALIGNDIGQLLAPWEMPPSPSSTQPSRFPLYPQKNGFQNQFDPQVWRNPPPNVNVITNAEAGGVLYFPPVPPNGARMALINVGLDYAQWPLTISGNGRLIEGAQSLVLSTSPTAPIGWLYRDDLANWVRFTDLELTSDSPLPPQFDDFIVAGLSIRRAPAYNKEPSPVTIETERHGHRLLKTTYLQTNPGATFPGAWRFNTYQSGGTPWRASGPGGW